MFSCSAKTTSEAEDDIEANKNKLGLTEQQFNESLKAVQDSIKLLDEKKFTETKQRILPIIKLFKNSKVGKSKIRSTVLAELERCVFWLDVHF